MYKYKYLISKKADKKSYIDMNKVILERFPELAPRESTEGELFKIIFTDTKNQSEKFCLSLDCEAERVELLTEEKQDFLKNYNFEQLYLGESSLDKLSRWKLIAIECGFLIMDFVMGYIGFVGGFDSLFDYPLKYFFVSLPFALVYFFSYPFFKRKGFSALHTRSIQLGAAIVACIVAFFLASDWTGAIVLLILKYSVHLMIYRMATAVILDTTISFVKKALSMRNCR